MSEIVAWRYRWQHDTKWVHSSEEPDAYPNRVVEPLCVATKPEAAQVGDGTHEFSADWYRPSSCMLCSFKRDHPIHARAVIAEVEAN